MWEIAHQNLQLAKSDRPAGVSGEEQDILADESFLQVMQQAEPAFRKYGINNSEFLGRKVKVTRGKRKKRNFFTYQGKKFELRLLPKNYRVKRCGKSRTKIFTLALLGVGGRMKILQRDKKLYRSRGCPVDYTVDDTAYVYKNGIVAFVYSTTPSRFGGKAHSLFKPLVVSGRLGKVQVRAAAVSARKGSARPLSQVTGRLLYTLKGHVAISQTIRVVSPPSDTTPRNLRRGFFQGRAPSGLCFRGGGRMN